MECDKSENLFFGFQDVFLNMTMLLSVKTLYLLRKVCKSLNSWLSDPNTFAWKQRVRSAFPLSYESVLQKKMDKQIQELARFDTLVESGHQVSFFGMGTSPILAGRSNSAGMMDGKSLNRFQIPWQKDLYIIYGLNGVVLFDSTARTIVAQLELPDKNPLFRNAYKIVFDVKEHKVGFVDFPKVPEDVVRLKLYKLEDSEFIHERDIIFNDFPRRIPVSHINDDTIILKRVFDEHEIVYEYSCYSVSEARDLYARISYEVPESMEKQSIFEPVMYICLLENDGKYKIYELQCTTFERKEIYDGNMQTETYEVEVELIENEQERYLYIYSSLSVQIVDLQKRKLIFNQMYDDEKDDDEGKDKCYYDYAWQDLKYNAGGPYYSTTSRKLSNASQILCKL
eukprot:TRINITY_DN594_c0_g1_i2.p1 TRINITY_DN594_c0_g1~~TRINITY_DN594_c0_g1_i2.p1  ORF type:complete len:397 (-),score=18.47 TRINITY_DN594_c0_g1_i2:538-1728(-)